MKLKSAHLHWGASKHGEAQYRSYSLARSFREGGKSKKEILLRLGKLDNDTLNEWQRALQAAKDPDLLPGFRLEMTGGFEYLDVAVVYEAWRSLGLESILPTSSRKKDKGSTAKIAALLTINRCLAPCSKHQVPDWMRRTALPALLDLDPSIINRSRIFRELDVIEAHKEKICRHLYEKIHTEYPEELDNIFFDLSTVTYSGTKCELSKYGHCKEGFEEHFVLGLLVSSTGEPFYWEVLPGNTSDVSTIKTLLQRVRKDWSIDATVVFDRGFVSEENLNALEQDKIRYVTALKKSQLETITGFDFKPFATMDLEEVMVELESRPDFHLLGDTVYYRSVAPECTKDPARRHVLCFSSAAFTMTQTARKRRLQQFRQFVRDTNLELANAKRDRKESATLKTFTKEITKRHLSGFVTVTLAPRTVESETKTDQSREINTFLAKEEVDIKKMGEEGAKDGFWLLVSNQIERGIQGDYLISASDLVVAYQEKVVIESSFRDIKSYLDIRPVHVRKTVPVQAHCSLCFLAHAINRKLTRSLHQNSGDVSKTIVWHESLYSQLRGCRLSKMDPGPGYKARLLLDRLSKKQKELLIRLGMDHLYSQKILSPIIRRCLE